MLAVIWENGIPVACISNLSKHTSVCSTQSHLELLLEFSDEVGRDEKPKRLPVAIAVWEVELSSDCNMEQSTVFDQSVSRAISAISFRQPTRERPLIEQINGAGLSSSVNGWERHAQTCKINVTCR